MSGTAAELYDRIKVRFAGARPYLVDTVTAHFIPEVRRYIDRRAHRCSDATLKNRCYLLRHIVVYAMTHGIAFNEIARDAAEYARFQTWLANPYRTISTNVIPAKKKSEMKDALESSSIVQIERACRGLLRECSNRSRALSGSTITDRTEDQSSASTASDAWEESELPAIRRSNRDLPKTYDDEALGKMLQHCTFTRDKALLSVLHEAGPRLGELLGLRLQDFDFERQGVWIRSRSDNPNGATVKSRRNRFLQLPECVVTLIDQYIMDERYIVTEHDMLWVNLNRRFPEQFGRPLQKSSVYALYRKFKRNMGISTLHPHMSRHTHLTNMAQEQSERGEVDYGVLSVRAGHSSQETTRRFYVHFKTFDHKRQYMRYAEKKFGGKDKPEQ